MKKTAGCIRRPKMRTFARKICTGFMVLFIIYASSLEFAWAKAFDMEMVGITVTAQKPADQVGPNTFYLDSEVKVECRYRWGEFPLNNPPPPLLIQFFHDPPFSGYVNFSAGDAGPPAATGTVGTATATFKTYTTGTIKVWCDIHKKAGGNLSDANVGNNKKEVLISVKPRSIPKSGLAPLAPGTAKPGAGSIPGLTGNIKQCPTSLSATVKVDPQQLVHPLNSPADMAETKVMLYLQKSEAAANNINCYYASNNKDVPNLVITIKCPNASPQGGQMHSYSCTQQ